MTWLGSCSGRAQRETEAEGECLVGAARLSSAGGSGGQGIATGDEPHHSPGLPPTWQGKGQEETSGAATTGRGPLGPRGQAGPPGLQTHHPGQEPGVVNWGLCACVHAYILGVTFSRDLFKSTYFY